MKIRLFNLTCLICIQAILSVSSAVEVQGDGWTVLYNLPDGNGGVGWGDDEYRLHRHLVKRIDQLGSGDTGTLMTFTFSGNDTGAGRILQACDAAIQRGAVIRFIGDREINPNEKFDNRKDKKNRSLSGLARTHGARFRLVIDDSKEGIHHNKLGLFDYSGSRTGREAFAVFVSSQNFTGASSFQWNIAIDIENESLYRIYEAEARELLAGRFHDHTDKSHRHDNRPARVNSELPLRVRFSPPTNPDEQSITAHIVSGIDRASTRIVFALNRLTDPLVVEALVRAADRGVSITGCITASEITSRGSSREAYKSLRDAKPKTPIRFVQARLAAGKAARDTEKARERNVLHTKYMVIDDRYVIHGSANWTQAALRYADQNDENVLVMQSPQVAAAFLQQFRTMTGKE